MIAAYILMLAPSTGITVAVEGDGYLRLAFGGKLRLVRKATLIRTGGALGTAEGELVAPRLAVPAGTIAVDLDGTVRVDGKSVGRLVLAIGDPAKSTRLVNPGEGLTGVVRTVSLAPLAANSVRTKAASAEVSITIRPASTVDGDRIVLGDVAEISAPAKLQSVLRSLDLGRAPVLGTTIAVSPAYVRSLIRGLGVKPEMIRIDAILHPTVSRQGVTVEAQAIADAAMEIPEAKGFVVSRPPLPLVVTPGTLELVASASPRLGSLSIVEVDIRVDGKSAGHRLVSVVPDPNIPSVKAGDAVRVRLVTGAIEVEIAAKVKTGGRLGESVTAVSATGAIHTGKLILPDLIEVRL